MVTANYQGVNHGNGHPDRPEALRHAFLAAGLATVPALAGIAYAVAWLAGLSIFSSSATVRTTGAKVLAADAGHQAAAATQFVLTEGASAVFLAVVVIAIGRAGLRTAGGRPAWAAGTARAAWVTMTAGLAAVAISLVQCVLGVYLTTSVVPAGHVTAAGDLTDAISRLDGVKMLVLAVLALAGVALARRTPVLPGWLSYAGVALAVAIVVSGVGYLLLIDSLALAAWASLPLLLVWVTGSGIALGRAGR
jgi:hypothetical protein